MNVDRLEQIAQWLENGAPHKQTGFTFHMNYWTQATEELYEDKIPSDCGSVACIGGATEQFFNSKEVGAVFVPAKDLLDLSDEDAHNLFYPSEKWSNISYDHVTPAEAASVIRNLIKTGVVDWFEVSERHYEEGYAF